MSCGSSSGCSSASGCLVVLAPVLRIPYPILLVLGGLALAFVPGLPDFELRPEVVLLGVPAAAALLVGLLHLAARPAREPPAHLPARDRPRRATMVGVAVSRTGSSTT